MNFMEPIRILIEISYSRDTNLIYLSSRWQSNLALETVPESYFHFHDFSSDHVSC